MPLNCMKSGTTDDNDSTLDGKLHCLTIIKLNYYYILYVEKDNFLYFIELICSSVNHSPNFNRPTSHKTSSSLLSRRKTRIPSINSIPVSVRKINFIILILINIKMYCNLFLF